MVLATQMPAPAPAEDLRGPRRRAARSPASAPRTSSSPSSPGSASAAAPATCSSTPARPSGALTMEQRMTICNMCIEGGARAGLIAPDDTTFEYVARPAHAPTGAAWDAAVAGWRTLPTDDGATLRPDRSRSTPSALEPMVTYGTNPGMGIPITSTGPRPRATRPIRPPAGARDGPRVHGPRDPARRSSARRSTSSSSARARTAGSATCASRPRSSKDRQVADGVRVMVVPGSRGGEARGGAGGPRRGVPGGRRRVARGRLLDVHRDERRPASSRASTRSRTRTATSRGARARAGGRSSRRR